MQKHMEAIQKKLELKELLREFTMERISKKYPINKYFEGLQQDPLVKLFRKWVDKLEEVEKRVMEFFTFKREHTSFKLFEDLKSTPGELFNELRTILLCPNNVFDLVMSHNRYSDKVFLDFFQVFRSNAFFLSISMAAEMSARNLTEAEGNEILNVTEIAVSYSDILNALQLANDRRETNGFKFDNLFTDATTISRHSNLPYSDAQNMFVFNLNSETFDEKFTFITYRQCNLDDTHLVVISDSMTPKSDFGCNLGVMRYKIADAPEGNQNRAKMLLDAARSVLEKSFTFKTRDPVDAIIKAIEHPEEVGLIAVGLQQQSLDSLTDNVYYTDRTYKVVLSLPAKLQTQRNQWDYSKNKYIAVIEDTTVQVIGYFMKPVNANY